MALTENFNSYTDGDLNGQGSWVGNANFDIQGVVIQEGAKAVENLANANVSGLKSFTPTTQDGQQFYAKPETGSTGMITQINNAVGTVISINHSTEADGAWHKYNVEWDGTRVRDAGGTGKYRIKIDDGSWTVWTDGAISFTTLDRINLKKGAELLYAYWDNFTEVAITISTFSVSDTISLTESISAIKGIILSVSDSIGLTEAITTIWGASFSLSDNINITENSVVSVLWTLVLKSVSSWTNKSKNSSTFTNRSKNSSTWTNRNKSQDL